MFSCGAGVRGTIERHWTDAQGNGFYLAGNCFTLSEEEIKSLTGSEEFEKLIMVKAFIGIRKINNNVVEEENCLKSFERVELSDYQKNLWKSGHWARLYQYENVNDRNYIDIWIYTDAPIPPKLTEDMGSENGGASDSEENALGGSMSAGIAGGQQNLAKMVPSAVASVVSSLTESTMRLQNDVKNEPRIKPAAEPRANQAAIHHSAADKTTGKEALLWESAMWAALAAVVIANLCLGFNLMKDFKILCWYKEKKKEHLRKEGNYNDRYRAYLSADSYLDCWSGDKN